MDVREFVSYLKATADMAGQIAHIEVIAPRDTLFGNVDRPLDTRLEDCLKAHKLWPLYSHQADAVNASIRGEHVFITTPAASGKSLAYYIPVFEVLLTDPKATALYLAPTKALAQDQKKHVKELFSPDIVARGDFDTFDGDTPAIERAAIRRDARFILSNADMLHVSILPN